MILLLVVCFLIFLCWFHNHCEENERRLGNMARKYGSYSKIQKALARNGKKVLKDED